MGSGSSILIPSPPPSAHTEEESFDTTSTFREVHLVIRTDAVEQGTKRDALKDLIGKHVSGEEYALFLQFFNDENHGGLTSFLQRLSIDHPHIVKDMASLRFHDWG